MGIIFEIRDRKTKQTTEGENVSITGKFHALLFTDSKQPSARCIVGYIPSSCSETDDEGASAVEGVQTERTPLIKKASRNGRD
jgi:hypothetical protein